MSNHSNQSNLLNYHEEKDSPESEELIEHKLEYVCPFPGCNEIFYRKNNLTNHFKAHAN